MKTKIIYLLVVLVTFSYQANASKVWGPTGHRVVGEIAQDYLKPKTKRKLKKLLKKKTLAFLSTYGDEIKSDKRYNEFYTWHYVNMPLDENYDASKANPKGNLVTGIAHCKKVIKDENSSDEDKAFYLKLLIHLIGDLHQPMHIGLSEDRGGNDFKVQWHYSNTNLHAVWDYKMIERYDMGYKELAENADVLTRDQVKVYQEGTVIDWVNEVHVLTNDVYANVKKEENLRYRYSYKYFNIVRTQMQIGGIRLAKVLNDLF
ncbi:MAG: S1/P1 Nuclease [Lutibacter sp.]|nr:MAG: S1/P1 Nuclease [Lutibacter sp.]